MMHFGLRIDQPDLDFLPRIDFWVVEVGALYQYWDCCIFARYE